MERGLPPRHGQGWRMGVERCLRDRFVTAFGEMLAVQVEAAVACHVPRLPFRLESGSDPFRFALVWAVGLECLSRPEFRIAHSIEVPWELLRDWLSDADLLAGFDGSMDDAGWASGLFAGILPPPTREEIARGQLAAIFGPLPPGSGRIAALDRETGQAPSGDSGPTFEDPGVADDDARLTAPSGVRSRLRSEP